MKNQVSFQSQNDIVCRYPYRLQIHVDVTQTFLSERLQKNSEISNEKPEAFVEETVTYFPFPVITSCHDVTDHEDADDISR